MGKGSQHRVGRLAALALVVLLGLGAACGSDGPAPGQDGAVDASGGDGGGGLEALCTQTGGTAGSQLCCGSVTDFPDTCGVGNCGCSPSASHQVQVCTCPSGKCFAPDKGCKTP
ncbi:MAG: hypothetical protein HY906_04015 [Deltaproteobacteria bacterium]|nr:hypothetical protein [Deltaproteobacteria bacterium]